MKAKYIATKEDLMDYVRGNPTLLKQLMEHLPGKHDQSEHTTMKPGKKLTFLDVAKSLKGAERHSLNLKGLLKRRSKGSLYHTVSGWA